MCYVGKATKIFFFVVGVLVVVGLVMGFGVFHHEFRKSHKCDGGACERPIVADPIPAATSTSAAPLISPTGPVTAVQGPAVNA